MHAHFLCVLRNHFWFLLIYAYEWILDVKYKYFHEWAHPFGLPLLQGIYKMIIDMPFSTCLFLIMIFVLFVMVERYSEAKKKMKTAQLAIRVGLAGLLSM